MNININDIFEFSQLRITCHVRSLNYFAAMFGLNFPDHDGDKNKEPMRTGYAYIVYAMYHKNFHLTPEHEKLCEEAKETHHKHATHHIAYYQNISDIPDIRIYEMVSDWASANFEQKEILCANDALGLIDWFNKNRLNENWTAHQLDLIQKAFKIIDEKSDSGVIKSIWMPVLEKSDL